MLRVLDIVAGTSVDGPGLRTSVYFAGCTHRCPGCHNPQSWDADAGVPMTVDQIMDIIADNDFNVTFSGGDPLMQPPHELTQLAQRIRGAGYTLWCYTGYTHQAVLAMPQWTQLLHLLDALVDGPYVAALRDTALQFRGSSNQRIIHHPAQPQ